MKFAATFFMLAASAAAWTQTTSGPGVNPDMDKVLEGMPDDLVPFLGYVPHEFMEALIGGKAWLPLTPQEFLDIATDVPEESRNLFSEEYIKFISEVSSLLPSQPDQNNNDDKAEDTDAPSATGSEEGNLSEDEVSDDMSSGKESVNDHIDNESENENENKNKDSESSGASALACPIAAIAVLAAAVSYF